MCGIGGVISSPREEAVRAAEAVGDLLAHRGPDGAGIECVATLTEGRVVVLTHRRLAIIDLSEQAAQPMRDSETGNWIVYNGELYNFRELRRELEGEGVRFVSHSDTEVVLKCYGRWGLKCLDRLIGMFAFGLWDEARERLILVRDRLGIKPLYYYCGQDCFLFASEVRALLATGLVRPRVDPLALESYLAYGAVQAPLTMIRGIRSLLPAHYLVVEASGLCHDTKCYWSPPFARHGIPMWEAQTLAGGLRHLLEQVVYDHLVSDVPLGAFLSGGIDSSSIVGLMSRVAPDAVHTFSVTFQEKAFSEAPYSRMVAERYSKQHTEICLGEEQLLSILTEALNAMDQPTIDGINVYVISKVVREAGVTVVLSGQGGDELFAGYPTFKWVHRLARYRFLWEVVPAAARGLLGKSWSRLSRRDLVGNKVSQILCSDGGVLPVYLIMRQLFSPEARRRLFPKLSSPELVMDGLPVQVYTQLEEALQRLDPINQVSLLELRTYLANMLLRDGDFMSMAHGLEVRVPFLDHRVVEFVAQIPGALKVDRSLPKPLLLKVIGDLLPPPIYQRPKSGFTFPWELWLRGRLSSAVAAVLDSPEAGVSIGLAPGVCQRLWDNFLGGKPGITWSRVWGLFVLIEWARLNRAVYDDSS